MKQRGQPSRFANTRQQILDVAQSIILGKGFTAVGLNEILQAARVPKGSFYHYFESKEQFGNALLENYFVEYMNRLDTMLRDDGSSPSGRLLAYFENWLQTQCSDTKRDKCLVVKLSAEVTDLSETMRLTLKKGTEGVIDKLAECVGEAIRKGEIVTQEDPGALTREIYFLWIGATLLTKVNHNSEALSCAMHALKARLDLRAE